MNMSGASANFSFIGEGFVLMSQLCGAISAAFIKKFTQKQNAVLLSGYQFFLGGVLLIIIGYLMGGHITFESRPSSIDSSSPCIRYRLYDLGTFIICKSS